MSEIWCAGEGEYFASTDFTTNPAGVLIHTGKGHTITGDPESFPDRSGPLGETLPDP